MFKSKISKKTLQFTLVFFLLLNLLTFVAAWIVTSRRVGKSKAVPKVAYTSHQIKSQEMLSAWLLKTTQPQKKGSFILFHGYGGDKTRMLEKAYLLQEMGYDVLLVDFMGTSNSTGRQVTIGYYEAQNVKDSYKFLREKGDKDIYLLGLSMGAVAIMKAIQDYHDLKPKGIILECPYGTMRQAVGIRLRNLGLPVWGIADLMLFWTSVQNVFWAYSHQPVVYARHLNLPTLLLYDKKDIKVTRQEIENIYANLPAQKRLVIFPKSGHESYLEHHAKEWQEAITTFAP